MSIRSRTISHAKCPLWIYGPQVSDMNVKYGVGGETWSRINEKCKQKLDSIYKDFNPSYINVALIDARRYPELVEKLTSKLNNCETILDVLLIHSAVINAFGLLISKKKNLDTDYFQESTIRLRQIFDNLYRITNETVDRDTIRLFVTPEEFADLSNSKSPRPKNIVLELGVNEVITHYKLKNAQTGSPIYIHPIRSNMRICDTALVADCTLLFTNVKNALFEPLADVISCNCSFFKQKLVKTTSSTITFDNVKNSKKISIGDYEYFTKNNTYFATTRKPPILIVKYKDSDTTCDKKTYLSQLFEKVCMPFYRPYYIKAKEPTIDSIMSAAKENIVIATSGCRSYSLGNLSVFHTTILYNNDIKELCNLPVFFVVEEGGQQERVYVDNYSGPSRQFFTDVIKELLDKEVFIPSETFFNNQRYELNTKFDIEKLDCFKQLPDGVKTPEFKSQVTSYFFRYVGNLIHFAVANNIELPFKLSRVYIMKIFNILDFMEIDPVTRGLKIMSPDNLEQQMLLISLYLLEKASSTYTKQILDIFEDPKKLLTDQMLISSLDIDLEDENTETREKGIRMNGYCVINETNSHIYSDKKEDLFNNMVELLYKTALKHYFEDINSNTFVNKDFTMNKYLEIFFSGFEFYKNFESPQLYPMNVTSLKHLPFKNKLSILRKADIFLSGFGVTYDIIKNSLIPLLHIDRLCAHLDNKSPLFLMNNNGEFLSSYITDTSLSATDENDVLKEIFQKIQRLELSGSVNMQTTLKVRILVLFYRVLLNQGRDISSDFIKMYNNKFYNVDSEQLYGTMLKEDYHNEFVKLLLKAWSGSPNINTQGYKIKFPFINNKLPATHTCFNTMDIHKVYKTSAELYKDLIVLVTDGTNFGEALTGGKKNGKRQAAK